MSENELKEELIALLKSHDWFYEYCDDHRLWSKGHNERKRIGDLVAQLSDEGAALMMQYMPKNLGG